MRAWRSRLVLLVGIGLLPLEITFIVSLWPYLGLIGRMITGLVAVACFCLAAYGVAHVVFFILEKLALLAATRRRAKVVEAAGLAILEQADGTYRHLSAEHEAAKLLPAPRVQVSEESAPVGEDGIDHWRILELAGKGMDLRSVALACNTSYYHVQRITSTWKKKLEAS